MKGWHFGKYYPSNFNGPLGRLMHRRLVEHDVRTPDDLPVLGVPESVSDLAVGSRGKLISLILVRVSSDRLS